MTLKEAINFLEKYYTKYGMDCAFISDEVRKLHSKIIDAFQITPLEWEEELLSHQDLALVSFSKLYNCLIDKDDIIKCFKGNIFIQAVVPKVCARIWDSYFNDAKFYEDGEILYNACKKEKQLESFSFEINHVMKILGEIEQSGYGFVVRQVNQKVVTFIEKTGFVFGINNVEEDKSLCQFVTMEDGTVRFVLLNPLLEDLIMSVADRKFAGDEKKLIYGSI